MSGFDVAGWAALTGMYPRELGTDDLVAFTDQDVSLFVSRRASGAYVVETSSHGGLRFVEGSFTSEQDALRYLVMNLGRTIRANRGLREIWAPEPAPETSVEDGPTSRILSWANGSAEFALGVMGEAHACDFSTVIGMSLDDIAKRYDTP